MGFRPPDVSAEWQSPDPVDMRVTLQRLGHGAFDPCHRWARDGSLWRTTRTAAGPAVYRLEQRSRHDVRCDAWGSGARAVVDSLPDLLGERDDPESFDPQLPVLEETHRRNPGMRIPRSGRVLESLIPAIIEQRVYTQEAFRSWRWLVTRYGMHLPAGVPAPHDMRIPPDAADWRSVPSWDWHRAGVDSRRARTAIQCAQVADRLEECVEMELPDARARLRLVPGVGVWTAAEVAQRALGDPDALSVGDFHLAAFVGWALVGRKVDDEEMLQLLEPWRGHRYRVVRLLQLSGFRKPTFAPRMPLRQHLHY